MEIDKLLPLLATLAVGLTFFFSGVIKLNDPVGFNYKIEEYLHVLASQWSSHLRLFLPYTLALAVAIATLEVLLGTALLAQWQHYWALRALLLLTLFFTGLTLYTATSSRMASCGCFGDAWDLTPWQSFAKSIVLLLLIAGLLKAPAAPTTSPQSHYWLAAALLGSLALATYTIRHLPWVDFGPYAVGSSLAKHLQPRHPLRYLYVLEKDGQILEMETYPQAPEYKLISSRLLNPEDAPEGTDLSVWQGQNEVTPSLLTGRKLLIIVPHQAALPQARQHQLRTLLQHLPATLRPILLSTDESLQGLAKLLELPIHTAAPTLLRTLLRAPAGLLLLHEGVVQGKWHYRDLAQAQKQLTRSTKT